MYSSILLIAFVLSFVDVRSYQVPQATVEALKPRGLRFSIPDTQGTQLFAVHANINRAIQYPKPGRVSNDAIRAVNGRWIVEIPNISARVGDTVNYWIYVQADGQPHHTQQLSSRITKLVDPREPTTPAPPACHSSVTMVNGKPACQGQLIFEDNFDTFATDKWQHVVQFAGAPDYEFVVYTGNEGNSFVSGGNLHIRPSLLSDSGLDVTSGSLELSGCTENEPSGLCSRTARAWYILPPVKSALLTTKEAFCFRYGRVEVQAKLPTGDWIFPEIWLKSKGGERSRSGLIQLALARGNRDLTINGSDIGSRYLTAGCTMNVEDGEYQEYFSTDQSTSWSNAFHIYSVTWTPHNITFSVDGSEVGCITVPNDGIRSVLEFARQQNTPFDQEFFLSIGLGVGGFQYFPDNCISNNRVKPWTNMNPKAMLQFWRDKEEWYPTWNGDTSALQVDYVKVWAL